MHWVRLYLYIRCEACLESVIMACILKDYVCVCKMWWDVKHVSSGSRKRVATLSATLSATLRVATLSASDNHFRVRCITLTNWKVWLWHPFWRCIHQITCILVSFIEFLLLQDVGDWYIPGTYIHNHCFTGMLPCIYFERDVWMYINGFHSYLWCNSLSCFDASTSWSQSHSNQW